MSQFNTFLVPLNDSGAAQEQLNLFLRTHRVLQVERAAFPSGWAFCVEWIDGTGAGNGGGGPLPFYRAVPKVDYREVLSPEVFARFAKLRERRKAIALADGVKPYVVMTDAQLAELAKAESPSLADLRKIEGVGEARIEKFAERLLTKEPHSENAAPPVLNLEQKAEEVP